MKILTTKHLISFTVLVFFLMLAVGSETETPADDSETQGTTESKPTPPVKTEPPKSSKYTGSYRGQWEGFLLDQYNSGTASFNVDSDGSAVLRMSSQYGDATHTGYIRNDRFIITSGSGEQSGGIVQLSSGFKIALMWTGMNADVYLQ
jgi:hypothetical protein